MDYIRLWLLADGSAEYGQAIRWRYLLGQFGKDPKATKRLERLDNRNFKKWNKIHNENFQSYLKVARV